jgi:hypothetical protein
MAKTVKIIFGLTMCVGTFTAFVHPITGVALMFIGFFGFVVGGFME